MITDTSVAGKRVLEMGGYLAAPFAGMLLSELGADVIKIEGPRGDPTRGMVSSAFVAANVGKRSIGLDLKSDEGHAVFERLVRSADIVIHNLDAESTRQLRVTFDECERLRPGVVYCHIKGFGPGPNAHRPATNPIIEALTGVMAQTRVDGRPARQAASFYDLLAGTLAALGATTALGATDPRSRHVEIGLFETGVYAVASRLIQQQLIAGSGATPAEWLQPGYNTYETADGQWVYLGVLDAFWPRFRELMGLEGDATLATPAARKANAVHVEDVMKRTIAAHALPDLLALLESAGIPCAHVKGMRDVLDDPQLRMPGKLVDVDYKSTHLRVPAFPMRTGMPSRAGRGVPTLGEHSVEILASLGYEPAEAGGLVERGVVRAA